MSNNMSPKEKFEHVMLQFYREDPMLLSALGLLNYQEDPRQETIGLDTHSAIPRITYNPNFVETCSTEVLEHVMSTEGLKLLLNHPYFRSVGMEPWVSSLASKVTVGESMLREFKRSFPDDSLDDLFPTPETYGMQGGKFFEAYASLINEEFDEIKEKIQQLFQNAMPNNMKEEDGQESKEGQPSISNEQEGEQQNQCPDEGSGESSGGEDQSSQTSGNGFKEFKDQSDALKHYFNPMGTSDKDWGENSILQETIKEMIKHNDNLSSKQWGSHTGNFREKILAAHKDRVNVKSILNKFSTSLSKEDDYETRSRMNRRFLNLLPGEIEEEKAKIIWFTDVSGSMSSEVVEKAFSYVEQFVKNCWIDVACFDTQITDFWKNVGSKRNEWVITGRGGTDFNEVIKFIDNQSRDDRYDGCIVFTDGYSDMPKKPKYRDTKFLWILSDKNEGFKPDFGVVVNIKDIIQQADYDKKFGRKK